MRSGFQIKLFSACLFLLFSTALLAADPIWIDVRTAEEYNSGHVAVAVNIPHTEIASGISALTEDKDALIYLYCRSGHRAGIAKKTLDGMGYSQVINVGGIDDAMKKFTAESVRETAQ